MITDPLLVEADRCVKCGLCLPHCPTYLKLVNEGDSPRGRIALAQALVSQELGPTPALRQHLESCLGCRACEQVCPSGVAFGQLIDGVKARMQQQQSSALKSWLLNILSERPRLQKVTQLLSLLQRSRLLALGRRWSTGNLRRLIEIAEQLSGSQAQPGLYPARRPGGKSLQLFIGCASSNLDKNVITAAIQVLTTLGYAVDIPATQVCCGALYRHNGYPEQADQLCQSNRAVSANSRSQALITLASACHLELNEQQASQLPVHAIQTFLLEHRDELQPLLNPSTARVAVHVPCTARNDQTLQLLMQIPGLQVFALAENNLCCGAAGSYLLTQPKLSNAFGLDKLSHLNHAMPDILVTSNTGCAIQFRFQIRQANLDIEVLHPVELIARQLNMSGFMT